VNVDILIIVHIEKMFVSCWHCFYKGLFSLSLYVNSCIL